MTPSRWLLIASLIGMIPGAPHLWSQTGVVISGRVYDADTSKPIPGVRITTLYSPVGAGEPVPVLARSNEDGSFALAVAPGRHVVCADAGRAYLDQCQWARSSVDIDITRSVVLDLPLRRGVLVMVRLHDASDVVQAARKANPALEKIPSPPLSVLLTDDTGVIRPVPFVTSIGTSSEFSTVVPENTKFQLNVASLFLALADTSGKQLVQNAFKESLTSPALASALLELSPLGRPVGLRIPSRVFNFVATGLVAH